MSIIEEKSEEIQETCKEHKVNALYVFGSVVSDSFSEESAILIFLSHLNEAMNSAHLHSISILKKSWKLS